MDYGVKGPLPGVQTHLDRDSQWQSVVFENPEIVEALKYGDINEVMRKLPQGVTAKDVEIYLASQARSWQANIIQEQRYEVMGAIPEPDKARDFGHINIGNQMVLTAQE